MDGSNQHRSAQQQGDGAFDFAGLLQEMEAFPGKPAWLERAAVWSLGQVGQRARSVMHVTGPTAEENFLAAAPALVR